MALAGTKVLFTGIFLLPTICYITIGKILTEEDITFKQKSIWGNKTSQKWVRITHTHMQTQRTEHYRLY